MDYEFMYYVVNGDTVRAYARVNDRVMWCDMAMTAELLEDEPAARRIIDDITREHAIELLKGEQNG
jgi:hypothetical protein